MLTMGADERRRRIARRHRLAPGSRARTVEDAARSVVCLHATDPVSVYLSAWARVDGFARLDMERALYEERTLVKHLAMRRTIFAFPRDLLPLAQSGSSERVAATERRTAIRDVEAAGLHRDGSGWLDKASAQVLAALSGGREATMAELRKELPLLEGSIEIGVGKRWAGRWAIGGRVLSTLSASGRILRGTNAGSWAVSRPRWAITESWLGAPLESTSEAEGVAELVQRWLRAFGPGTEADIKWWLGSTLTAVRRALAELGAVEVEVDGRTGYLLPDDLELTPPVEPWAALLPALDPTTMGWIDRTWYLGDYRTQLFDTAGNAGPTVWWDGRIVGGWRQDEDGAVELQLLEDIGLDGRAALDEEAARLTSWLDGKRVLLRFPSPLFANPGG
jgi:hypothetical protein